MQDKQSSEPAGSAKSIPKPLAKNARLIKLLGRAKGIELAVLSDELCWLPHTTRAAISRLRKAGHEIKVVKGAKGAASRYKLQPLCQPVQKKSEAATHGA